MQKSKQNPNMEAKNRESYWTVMIAILKSRIWLIVTPLFDITISYL